MASHQSSGSVCSPGAPSPSPARPREPAVVNWRCERDCPATGAKQFSEIARSQRGINMAGCLQLPAVAQRLACLARRRGPGISCSRPTAPAADVHPPRRRRILPWPQPAKTWEKSIRPPGRPGRNTFRKRHGNGSETLQVRGCSDRGGAIQRRFAPLQLVQPGPVIADQPLTPAALPGPASFRVVARCRPAWCRTSPRLQGLASRQSLIQPRPHRTLQRCS